MASVPEDADVVIVGGGFAGAATAYELCRAGVRDVLVLEREPTCGYHASGRNAALCRQLTEHDEFTDYTMRGAEFLRDPPGGFSDTPLLRRTGSVLLDDSAAAVDGLAGRARARGLAHERLSAAAVVEQWPVLTGVSLAGGVSFPTDGVIDVHALLQSYLSGARHRGARIEVNCAVTSIRSDDGGAVVTTSGGDVAARCVVVAAGAWAGEVGAHAGSSAVEFDPMLRHLFTTDRASVLGRDAPFLWSIGADEFYVRPEGEGYLLSGCDGRRVEPHDATVAAGAVEQLADKLTRVAPRLAELRIARSWACLRTFSPGRAPVVEWDRDVPWLFWVAGLGGHGATASAAIGETAAAKIATRVSPRLA